LSMLKYEQILRYSQRYQDMYDQNLNRNGNPEYIERCMQRETLNYFGFMDDDVSLLNYQKIGKFYDGDNDIKNAIQYYRINILKDCPLKFQDNYVDVPLLRTDGVERRLSQLLDDKKPNVIIAGSIT